LASRRASFFIVAPIRYFKEVVGGDSVDVGLVFEIRKAVKLH